MPMVESSKSAISTPPRSRVLLVEDDTATRHLVAGFLKRHGYDCIEAWTVASATRLLQSQAFDFVILDLELEDGEGYSLLRMPQAAELTFIVISARTEVVDRLLSFELGADDYMTKPIDLREMLLRLQRSKKRGRQDDDKDANALVKEIDSGLFVNMRERAIMKGNKALSLLNRREFKALYMFLERPNQVISRDEISKELTGRRNLKESRAVDVLVSNIRAKLTAAGSNVKIKNIRGEGYLFHISQKEDATEQMAVE